MTPARFGGLDQNQRKTLIKDPPCTSFKA